jgi:hypothetical protein
MIFAIGLISALWFSTNAEFVKTVNEQMTDGYAWQLIDCRQVNPELPAITINTHTGKSLVCNKLVK